MFYTVLRNLLFLLEAEHAHSCALKNLALLQRLRLSGLFNRGKNDYPVQLFNLNFHNPVGLAAGLDKNGDYIQALGALGFGFIEIGTVTPRPQSGNPSPRVFRLPKHQAIINRLGFNNKGVDYLVARVKVSNYKGILGINIGRNKDTPETEALDDYRICLEKVYPYADYVTLNISSPNTPGLRDLQKTAALEKLLNGLLHSRRQLFAQYKRHVPLLLKIAPDLSTQALQDIAELLLALSIDGVIVSNTTISRSGVEDSPLAAEAGGLSGRPLRQLAIQAQTLLYAQLRDKVPIIGVGGIMSGADAVEKFRLGARLIQIYSGLIYQGPQLIPEIITALRKYANKN